MGILYGETVARLVSQRIQAQQASPTALAALPSDGTPGFTFDDGMLCVTGVGGTTNHLWVWQALSSAAASSTVLIPVNNPTLGRWVQLI